MSSPVRCARCILELGGKIQNLTDKVAKGATWMVAMRLSIQSIGLISTLILVRLLGPEDFGIVAMVMAIVATIDLLRQFGFEIALIQNQNAVRDDYDTVWTLEVILAITAAIIIVLVAAPAARFYSEPRLVPIFYVIALANVIHGFQNIGIINFRKYLEFDREFRYNVVVKILGFIVTISLAFWLRSYWALVIGAASTKVLNVILSYTMHDYRPRFSLSAMGRLFNFSKWIFLNNLGIIVRLRSPDFILGKLVGATGLGLFTISYEISNLPTSQLIAPINRALLPAFSKISHDGERMSSAFVRVTAVMALLSLPIAFGIASTAELIGLVILGKDWLGTIPLIKVLAISGAIMSILSPVTAALISMGKPKVVALLSLFFAAVLVPSVIYSSGQSGVYGATLAILFNLLIFLPVYMAFGARYIGFGLRDMGTVFFRPTVASIVMYLVVSASFLETSSTVANLIISVITGATVYVLVMLILWLPSKRLAHSGEAYLFERFLLLLQRMRGTKTAEKADL